MRRRGVVCGEGPTGGCGVVVVATCWARAVAEGVAARHRRCAAQVVVAAAAPVGRRTVGAGRWRVAQVVAGKPNNVMGRHRPMSPGGCIQAKGSGYVHLTTSTK